MYSGIIDSIIVAVVVLAMLIRFLIIGGVIYFFSHDF